RLKSSGVVAGSITKDEEDDCVILDGDPNKPVAIENDSGADSDDLLGVHGGVKREEIFTNKQPTATTALPSALHPLLEPHTDEEQTFL
ncbi:unnamed protein product, partial [Ilex paraguariensis]